VVRFSVAVMFADGLGVRSTSAEQRAQLRQRASDSS
jgi:hypothetical protein